MVELKTRPTGQDVEGFIQGIADEKRRQDCLSVLALMREVAGREPQMWGESIVGFGRYHYLYQTNREGDWFLTGFSPRKANLTLYIMAGFDRYQELLGRLGKFKTGVSCLYIKRLEDVDLTVLRTLIHESVRHLAAGQTREV